MASSLDERNKAMVADRLGGKTYSELGKQHKLSVARVRTICRGYAAEVTKPVFQEVAVADPGKMFKLSPLGDYNPSALVTRRGMEIFDQMKTDDQVKASMWFKKLAALSTGWEVVSPEGMSDDWEPREFVQNQLDHIKGSFNSVLLGVLTGLDYGFSLSEMVFEEIEDGKFSGKVGLEAVKARHPGSFSFDTDEYGNIRVDGIIQRQNSGIKRLPRNKFVHFAYQQEFDNPYGKSDLEAAYQSWWSKSNVYRWLAMLLERFGIPPVFALYSPKGMTTNQVNDLLKVIERIQAATAGAIPRKDKESLEMWSPELGGQATRVFVPALDMYNRDIGRALLMPNLLGMSPVGERGSFARAKVEFDVFVLMITFIRLQLTDEIVMDQIVRPLVDLNFNVEEYPQFQFLPMTDEVRTDVMEIWTKLLAGNAVGSQPVDEDYIRTQLGFPAREEEPEDDDDDDDDEPGDDTEEPEDEDDDDGDEDDDDDDEDDDDGEDPDSPFPDKLTFEYLQSRQREKLSNHVTLPSRARRRKNRFEKNTRFVDIEKKLNELERGGVQDIAAPLRKAKSSFTKFVRSRFNGDASFIRQVKELKGMAAVENALGKFLVKAFNEGRKSVRDMAKEANMADAPSFVPADALKFLRTKKFWISGVISNDILDKSRGVLLRAVESGQTMRETIRDLDAVFEPFIGNPNVMRNGKAIVPARLETIVRTNATDAYNKGRVVEARKAGELLRGFEYSAILDDATCFSGPTHVLMDDGSIREIRDVRLGEEVLSGNGKARRVRAIKVSVGTKWTRLWLENYGEIYTTQSHPFWALQSGSYRWVRAVDLHAGDHIGGIKMPNVRQAVFAQEEQSYGGGEGVKILQPEMSHEGGDCSYGDVRMCGLRNESGEETGVCEETGAQAVFLQSALYDQSEAKGRVDARPGTCVSDVREGISDKPRRGHKWQNASALFEGMSASDCLQEMSGLRPAVQNEKFHRPSLLFSEMLREGGLRNTPGSGGSRGVGKFEIPVRAGSKNGSLHGGLCGDGQGHCGGERGILASSGQGRIRGEKNSSSEETELVVFALDGGPERKGNQSNVSQGSDHSVIPTPTGFALVEAIETVEKQELCYDLEVEGDHTYLVGPGVIVHNTEVCRHLDGKVFGPDDPRLSELSPPRHFNCRSVLVPLGPDANIEESDLLTASDTTEAMRLSGSDFGGPLGKTVAKSPVSLANINAEIGSKLVVKGQKDGMEHMTTYNRTDGSRLHTTSGERNRVQFSPAMTKVINDPKSKVIVHHNHPSSSSLSSADFQVAAYYPGVKRIYAYGHDGSKYWGEAAHYTRVQNAYDVVQNRFYDKLMLSVKDDPALRADARLIVYHLLNKILARVEDSNGKIPIKYGAILSKESAGAYKRHKSFWDAAVDDAVEESNVFLKANY